MAKPKTNAVYEQILKEYTVLKSAEDSKTTNARSKIEEANKQIDKNTSLMEAATKRGDLEAYAELKADTAKNTEIIKFFTGVLENAKRNASIDNVTAQNLYAMANKEIQDLKKEWHEKMIEALRPLTALTNDYLLQMRLLEMAKNKIKNNLEHTPGTTPTTLFENMHLLDRFDKILQCNEYKKLSPDVKGEEKFEYKRYDWQAPMMAELSQESKRW